MLKRTATDLPLSRAAEQKLHAWSDQRAADLRKQREQQAAVQQAKTGGKS